MLRSVVTKLLQTKLRVPPPRAQVVPRPRLLELLDRGMNAKLVLVSAPPGFGKTTLVRQWIATRPGGTAAWVSLDAADNDRTSFWAYVVAAVEAAAPPTGEAARSMLEGTEPRVEVALPAFLNELTATPSDLVIVLDDFHTVEAPDVHQDVEFVLDHLLPQVCVVVVTRSDPPLSLARMRVRVDLIEVRAADLRFTDEEAAAYLNDLSGLALPRHDVAALEARTEGWIAALQLAALSMQGRTDTAAFIATFTGNDRYVVDYLVDEVLKRQPETVRDFLLDTAVLDRLSGPLCDAVTGGTGGAAVLEVLDRANLFLVALDDRRRWYRYHHLFADLLRARVTDRGPERVTDLHLRASVWWEANGDPEQAIAHALAAGDADRAADMIEVAARPLHRSRQEAKLRRWLDALPDSVFTFRPVLAMAHVAALVSTGEARGVEHRLAAAERWMDASRDEAARAEAAEAGMVVRDTEALSRLPGAIALHRAGLAWMRGDLAETVIQARMALEHAGPDESVERGGASGILALAYWRSGDLDAAHAWWSEAVANLERAEHFADMLGCFLAMADIRTAQGRLTDARMTYERGLRLGTQPGRPMLRGMADMHVGLAELYCERNDLAAARRHLDAVTELGEALGLPQNAYRSRVATARLRQAEGDLAAAIELLDDAERLYAVISSRRFGPSRRFAHDSGLATGASRTRTPGRETAVSLPMMSSPTCASSSTSPSPECSPPERNSTAAVPTRRRHCVLSTGS